MWGWDWSGSWLFDLKGAETKTAVVGGVEGGRGMGGGAGRGEGGRGVEGGGRGGSCWEADELVTQCPSCLSHFNLFVRRHHCRNCGGVFCSECTSSRAKIFGYDNEERVCGTCYDNIRSDIMVFNKLGETDIVSRWGLLIGRIKNDRAVGGEVISRIYDGVPELVRADLWIALGSLKSKPVEYSTLHHPTPQLEEKIQMDVMRTFPEDPLIQSEQGRSALTRLLSALATFYPSIDYSQHNAFIAGMVLIVLGCEREEEAFWVLAQLFEKTKGPLAPGRVDSAVDYVRAVVEASYPDLAEHLASQRITLDIFVHRWLSTLYAYDLPLSYALRVWDLLLSGGHLFGPAFALAILGQVRTQIIECDANTLVQYFNHLPPALFTQDSTLLEDAFTHWSHIRKRLREG